MKSKQIKLSTNFWIVFSTVLILATGYLFYLNYYVVNNENQIISSGFRVLNQIGDNIDSKIKGYRKNANNITNYKKDSIFSNNAIKLKSKNSLNNSTLVSHDDYVLVVSENATKDSAFVTSYSSLMNGLIRKDVFDDLILFNDSGVLYNSMNEDIKLIKKDSVFSRILKLSRSNKDNATESFSIFSNKKQPEDLFFSGEIFDITISNMEYKAFIQPVSTIKGQWFVAGLIQKSAYESSKYSIKPWAIILISIVLILLIMGLPIIKLMVMSKTEQLKTGSIINFAISTVLGTALLVLAIFVVIENYSQKLKVDTNLVSLSESINKHFQGEIENSLKQLLIYDKECNIEGIGYNLAENILTKDTNYYPKHYPYGDYYFWVDANGKQTKSITVFKDGGKASDLKKRDYISKSGEWYFVKDTTYKFRLESIVSVSSGTIKVGISTPSTRGNSIPTIAVSSKFHSVIDPIIPKNYSYCIIDELGKVWFHSDKNRNRNENLLDECNHNSYLKAALYGGITKPIDIDYYNQAHRIHINKINELPLYLVTLYNKSADSSFHAQTTTTTFFFMGILFLILFIQIAGLLIIEGSIHWSVTKNIIMKLARPMTHHNEGYKNLITVNILLFIITIPLFVFHLKGLVAVLFTLTLLCYLFSYMHWVLNRYSDKSREIKKFMLLNFIILILINILGVYLTKCTNICWLFYSQAIVIATLISFTFFLKKNNLSEKNNYFKNYLKFLVVLIVMYGILPTLIFYKVSHNSEEEIRAKHIQLDLVQQIEKRNVVINDYYKNISVPGTNNNIDKLCSKRKKKGIYASFINDILFKDSIDEIFKPTANNYWDSLYCFLRPFYDNDIVENKYLVFNNQDGSGISWSIKKDLLLMKYNSLTNDPKYKTIQDKYVYSSLDKMNLYLPFHSDNYCSDKSIFFNSLFWIAVLVLLILFYFIIKFGTSKMFCIDIANAYSHQSFFERINNYLFTGNNLFISRISDIDETAGFCDELKSKKDFIYLDWTEDVDLNKSSKDVLTEYKKFCSTTKNLHNKATNGTITPDYLVVVVNNFDVNYTISDNLLERINLLKYFNSLKEIVIIVLSQSSTTLIKAYYNNLIKQYEVSKKDNTKLLLVKNAFEDILRKMCIFRQPLNYTHSHKDEEKFCGPSPSNLDMKELIANELSVTDYLRQLEPVMLEYYSNHCESINCHNKAERVLRRITQVAERYYSGLLNSCSTEEKYVLYDTADDLIINPKNEEAIINLLKKGLLIKRCDRIDFMNISFRRFVLQTFNKSQTAELELKMGKEAGNWKGYKTMLTIIIAALFLFIGIANQDFLANLNELFIAVGIGIAGITGILSKLSENNSSVN